MWEERLPEKRLRDGEVEMTPSVIGIIADDWAALFSDIQDCTRGAWKWK